MLPKLQETTEQARERSRTQFEPVHLPRAPRDNGGMSGYRPDAVVIEENKDHSQKVHETRRRDILRKVRDYVAVLVVGGAVVWGLTELGNHEHEPWKPNHPTRSQTP